MDKSSPASGQHEIHDVSVRGKRMLLKSRHSVKLPRLLQSGLWEPHLFVIFDHYLQADRNYVDMGAIVLPTMQEYLRTERPTILVSVHAFNYTDRAAEISAVIDSLSHDRCLYRRDGVLLDVDAVLQGRGLQTYTSENSDILASDSPWIRHE